MIVYYFGYIPIKTINGEVTDETMQHILQLTGDEIKEINTVYQTRSMDSVVDICMDMPSVITVNELKELLDSGEKYEKIADDHNNCVVLMVPLSRYDSPKFDIIDNRLNMSIKDKFCKINCVEVSCMKYVLLCMFNDKWAYSTVGKEKIISPLKLIIKL